MDLLLQIGGSAGIEGPFIKLLIPVENVEQIKDVVEGSYNFYGIGAKGTAMIHGYAHSLDENCVNCPSHGIRFSARVAGRINRASPR